MATISPLHDLSISGDVQRQQLENFFRSVVNTYTRTKACGKDGAAILSKLNFNISYNESLHRTVSNYSGTFKTPIEIIDRDSMNWLPAGVMDVEAAKWIEVRYKNNKLYSSNVECALDDLIGQRLDLRTERTLANILTRSFEQQIINIKRLYKDEARNEIHKKKFCVGPISMLPENIKENDIVRKVTRQDLLEKFNKHETEPVCIELKFGAPVLDYTLDTNIATTAYSGYDTSGVVTSLDYTYFERTLQNLRMMSNDGLPEGSVLIDSSRLYGEPPFTTTLRDDYATSTLRNYWEQIGMGAYGTNTDLLRMYNPNYFDPIIDEQQEKYLKERQAKLLSADEKAQKLLKDMISEVDFRRYKEKGYIIVKGESGRVYRIWNNNTMLDVYELEAHQKDYIQSKDDSQMRIIKPNELAIHLLKDDKLTLRRKLCIHSPSKTLPPTDEVILKFILAKNNEKKLLEMSHHFMQSETPAVVNSITNNFELEHVSIPTPSRMDPISFTRI